MPMILEDTMGPIMDLHVPLNDLDDVDLFGDAELPIAPNKALLRRVDELQSRGSCRRIAWSKQGTVASISSDSSYVNLQFLRIDPTTTKWGLSSSTPCRLFSDPLPGGPIVHLAWSPAVTPELAIVDAFGRLCILSFPISLNRPYTTRKWDEDPTDDLQAVVGSYWLPLAPPRNAANSQYAINHGPAIRGEDGKYDLKTTFLPASLPWHPNPAKSALVCVTAEARLKLFYSHGNNRYQQISLDLDSVASSDDLVTHAAMCGDRNKMLVALATSSGHLKAFHVVIDWNVTTGKPATVGGPTLNPIMREQLISTTNWRHSNAEDTTVEGILESHLSHLEVLSPTPDLINKIIVPPCILTARTYVPSTASAYDNETKTVIDRWQIDSEQLDTVHPAFEQLGLNVTAPSPPTKQLRLKKIASLQHSNKALLSIYSLQLGYIVCFAFSDGTLQYRNRINFEEMCTKIDTSNIVLPNQVGFQFEQDKSCVDLVLSPSSCSLIALGEDNDVTWVSMKSPIEESELGSDHADAAAIRAAISVATASAASHHNMLEDILAITQPFLDNHPELASDMMLDFARLIKINADYSGESHQDSLIRDQNLLTFLSLMESRGMLSSQPRLTHGTRFAKLATNIRNIGILITVASNPVPAVQEKNSPLDDADVVNALAGCAEWSFQLKAWLSDLLFELLDDEAFIKLLAPDQFLEVSSYLASKNNPSLQLLLCSTTRSFLSGCCRRLAHLEAITAQVMAHFSDQNRRTMNTDPHSADSSAPLHQAYAKMQRRLATALVKIADFGGLLASLTTDIRTAYKMACDEAVRKLEEQQPQSAAAAENGPSKAEEWMRIVRGGYEMNMLALGNPPPCFLPVLQKFFRVDLPKYRDGTDAAELFFGAYPLLEMADNQTVLSTRQTQRQPTTFIDNFQRCITNVSSILQPVMTAEDVLAIPKGHPVPERGWRRCVRCAAVMENLWAGARPGFTFVLSQQRRCSCGGCWALLPNGALIN